MIDHPYQLRRIELRDFKSVALASVELRPLSVVIGANSSGKSTMLQSILAVTQAVRSGAASAEFPLNGEFVRLGTFEETRNFRSSRPSEPMEIAFELVESSLDASTESDPLVHFAWRAFLSGEEDRGQHGVTSASTGFARLRSIQIELGEVHPGLAGEPARVLSCDISSFDGGPDVVGLPIMNLGSRNPASAAGARVTPAEGRVQDWQTGESAAVNAVTLSGGVPHVVLRRAGRFALLADTWWKAAERLFDVEITEAVQARRSRGNALKNPPRDAVTRAASDLARLVGGGKGDSEEESAATADETAGYAPEVQFLVGLGSIDESSRAGIAKSMVELGDVEFRRLLGNALANPEWLSDEVLVELSGTAGTMLARSSSLSQRFFTSGVRYLGPLREAPHVLYDPGPSKLDLGVKGEYAAAVLHAQAERPIRAPLPDGGETHMLLGEALDLWLDHFGLASQARSEDRGRIGIGLSVTPHDLDRAVDLTSVGVGVSQVLPVILLCLLAEPGSLLVLEQPELHLHPKLQQDLADFLLACARSGRQLVVETHSEHLVNRLRYRIAEDTGEETHELVGLVFAENEGGVTRYREPEINEYGGLGDDWPAGFLDLTARQAQDLVRQSLAKRSRDSDS